MRTLCVTLLIATLATAAGAGIPDPLESTWACRTDEVATVMVCPAGDSPGLDGAYLGYTTTTVDATIDVWLRDAGDVVIQGYPYEDICLDGPALVHCTGGTCAMSNTDESGHTTISDLWAGGHASGDVSVLVDGVPIWGSAPDLHLISPDINGDLMVDLSDVVYFARIFFGAYDRRADFYTDGTLNLSDIVIMSLHKNGMHGCD